MDPDDVTRQSLVNLLEGGKAHMTFEEAVEDFPMDKINTPFPEGDYTPWALLEHMRITQKDILDYIGKADYRTLDWPRDYWPDRKKLATRQDWDKTVKGYIADRNRLIAIAQDKEADLYIKLPSGSGGNILWELMLAADHNAYHTGEFAIMRQAMGTWGKSHG